MCSKSQKVIEVTPIVFTAMSVCKYFAVKIGSNFSIIIRKLCL